MYYYCAVINTKTTSGIHTVATEMSRAAAVVVTSAPVVPSSDAGLTSVAGQTDSNPGTQTGADAGNAIIWAVNVASEKATLARADIAVATNATFSLYSDAVFTTEVEDPATLALAVGDTVAYIKVTAEDGTTVKYYAVTIIRAAA
jgi:plastocyanin